MRHFYTVFMSGLSSGVLIFVVFSGMFAAGLLWSVRQARQQGKEGQAFFMHILPFVLADTAFVLVFVFWFLSQRL